MATYPTHPDPEVQTIIQAIVEKAAVIPSHAVPDFTEAIRRTCLAIIEDLSSRKAAERAAKARR